MGNDLGRVALITGGAKGIGAGIAARLTQDGWRVVVADREAGGTVPATRPLPRPAMSATRRPLAGWCGTLPRQNSGWTH